MYSKKKHGQIVIEKLASCIAVKHTSYKLASSCIAERLKVVCCHLLWWPNWLYFWSIYCWKCKNIVWHNASHRNNNNNNNNNKIPGILLLIDFEKAFDSVDWGFLGKALKFFYFGESFIQWAKRFYTNCQSCVIVNGHLSEWFYLQRGCRQRGPFIPISFCDLCWNFSHPRMAAWWYKRNYYWQCWVSCFTLCWWLRFILDGSQESLENCMEVLKLYAKASGLCVNIEKKN